MFILMGQSNMEGKGSVGQLLNLGAEKPVTVAFAPGAPLRSMHCSTRDAG